MSGLPLLSLAIWLPILGGLLVLATGSDRNAGLARPLALAVAVAAFGAVYVLLAMVLVLNGAERERFVWGPLRRLRKKGG